MSGISIGESLFALLVFMFFLIALRVATLFFKYRRSIRPPRFWPPPPPTPKRVVPKQETTAEIKLPTERLIREE